MNIIDLSEVSNIKDSGKDVSNGKVFINDGYPYCFEHGAMNKVSKDGIWRCLMCHVGCKEVV